MASTTWAKALINTDNTIDNSSKNAEISSVDEDMFDKIINLIDDGILLADKEATCIRINPAFTRISGLTEEQLIGKNHYDMEKTGIVSNSCVIQVLEKTEVVTTICEYPITHRKALVTGAPLQNKMGEIILVIVSVRDVTELRDTESQLTEERQLRIKYERKAEALQDQLILSNGIIVHDRRMINIIQMANRLGKVDSSILISGETGSGKEVVAQYIHQNGSRKDKPFIAVNCGAIPDTLIESELFGYEKGAFTGANRNGKLGLIEAADKGTLFLDEVGELPLGVQVKLLRFLQSREILRVGGVKPIAVNVRIIAASHRNLKKMISEGAFREDLYYRISVVPISIPPLRNRKDDIIPLTNHFLDIMNRHYGYKKTLSELAYRSLYEYHWPGNVRELKNIIERAVVITEGDIITNSSMPVNDLEQNIIYEDNNEISLKERMEKMEYQYIEDAYNRFHNVRDAAAFLKMSVATYARKRSIYKEKFNDKLF